MDISLNHGVVVSFSLHKWTWIPKSGDNLAGITYCRRMYPCAPETACQLIKHFLYGCMKWSEVNISLSNDVVASFLLLKWSWLPIVSGGNLASVTIRCAPICPWDSIRMYQTFCSCLIWIYEVVWCEYQPQPWRCDIISPPQVKLISQIWGQLGQCNCIRVQPYALETSYQCLQHFV